MIRTETVASLSLFTSIALNRADKRYQHLREQINQSLFVVAPKSGIVLDVNHEALELTGFSREELQNLSLSELIPAEEAPHVLAEIRELESGLAQRHIDVPMRNRTGDLLNVSLHASNATSQHDGESVIFLLADNTNKKNKPSTSARPEIELSETLDALTGLLLEPRPDTLESALDVCARFLGADLAAIYRVRQTQPGLQLIASYQLPGEFPLQIEPTDKVTTPIPMEWRRGALSESVISSAAEAAQIAAVFAHPLGERPASSGIFVAGFREKESTSRNSASQVRVAARYIHALVMALVRDQTISTRRLHTEHLQRHLNALMMGTNDGILLVDGNGFISRVNQALERLLGYQDAEVHGTQFENVVVDSNPNSEDIFSLLRSDGEFEEELTLVRRDGKTVEVLVRGVPILDPAGLLNGAMIIIADRTAHKTFEAQSRHLEQRAFLGDMSAIFAHEIRNPLNGISTGLQYLDLKADEDSTVHDAATKMLAEVNRIEALLTSTLQIARPSEMYLAPTDIRKLLDRLLYRWAPRLERRNIEFTITQAEEIPNVMGDTSLLEQVFTNLISNAMQAIGPEGGSITLKIYPDAGSPARPGDFVRVDVGDSGPGIPADEIQHIFDPFYTTKESGTGLGLALSHRIIHAHRGTIEVESWPQVGTVFCIYLPSTQPERDNHPENS